MVKIVVGGSDLKVTILWLYISLLLFLQTSQLPNNGSVAILNEHYKHDKAITRNYWISGGSTGTKSIW